MRECTTGLVIALLTCSLRAGFSQDKPPWVEDVERALQKEGWKPIRKVTYVDQKSKRFINVTIQMLNKEIDATIDIKVQKSTKEAREYFKSSIMTYKVMRRQATVNKFADLADENIIIARGVGWIGITFRKGRVITDVLAQSEETARSVAQIVANKIPSKN